MHIPEVQTLRPESCKCKCTSFLDSSCWVRSGAAVAHRPNVTLGVKTRPVVDNLWNNKLCHKWKLKLSEICKNSRLAARWLTSPRLCTVRPPRTIGKMGLPKKSKQKRHLKTIRVASSSVSRDQQCIAWKQFIYFISLYFLAWKPQLPHRVVCKTLGVI